LIARGDKHVLKKITPVPGSFFCLAAIVCPLCLLLLLAPPISAQTNEPTHVLILMQEDISWPVFRLIDENVRATLRSGLPGGVLVFSEHLDRSHFPDPAVQAEQVAWIKKKYADSNLALIMNVGDVPADLFPGVPQMFASANPGRQPPSRETSTAAHASLWVDLEAQKTLELAQRLQPGARRMVVIGEGAPSEDTILSRLRRTYPTTAGHMPITYVTNPAVSEICHTVSELGSDSIVLFTSLAHDEHGHPLIPAEVIPKVAAASGAPVYVLMDTFVGHGSVGGYVASFAEVGKAAGQLGLRLLAGEHPEDVVVRNVNLFDSRQLRRWKISESALPAGSVVLFRQPSLWESHKYYILAALLLCLIETLILLALLWQRAKRRKFEHSLLERVAFEKMLSDLSAIFTALPEQQVGSTIENSLGRIAEFLKLNSITLFGYSPEKRHLTVTYSWHGHEVKAIPAVIETRELSWITSLLLRGETVLASDLESLPEEASNEKESLRRFGVVSFATVPLMAGDQFFGAISFTSTKRRVVWTGALVEELKLLAEVFSNALARQRALDARFRHAALVESSDDAIVSKNLDGIIITWNASAQRLFGYSDAEIAGKPITILIPDERRDEEDIFLQRLRAGERVEHFETVRVAKAGKRIAVSLTISPVRDSAGKIAGFSEIVRDITDRKRGEQLLLESEERFRLVADKAPVLIWMSGSDKRCSFFNQGWLNFTGRSIDEELGDGWVSGVHPQDVQHCLDIYSASFDARADFEMEYRLRRFDGEYRWIVDYGVPRFEPDGTFCGYIGSCVDITERKSSEESLQALTGRLINAHEEERARIARDLHDDFNQRLALQCIDIEQLQKNLPELAVEERAILVKMLKQTKAMSADIRSLSHELHSSRLEFIGLVPAIRGLCQEISEKYKIVVRFIDSEIPFRIPEDVALCLFRVTQEALANVVKHSQTKNCIVELMATGNCLNLRITDEGRGFDPLRASANLGLGLVGMTERLRHVGGRLAVQSEPNKGTVILAEVPITAPIAISADDSQRKTVRAAGQSS
jgi:PAS domain S-box-containing protein